MIEIGMPVVVWIYLFRKWTCSWVAVSSCSDLSECHLHLDGLVGIHANC